MFFQPSNAPFTRCSRLFFSFYFTKASSLEIRPPRTRRRKNCLHMPTVRRLSKARRAEKWQFNLCTDTLAQRKEGCQEPEGKWKWLNNDENNDGGQRGGSRVPVCVCVWTDNEERLLVNIKLEYKGRRKARRRLQSASAQTRM